MNYSLNLDFLFLFFCRIFYQTKYIFNTCSLFYEGYRFLFNQANWDHQDEVLIPCSPGVVIELKFTFQEGNSKLEFSSPVLRDSYRSDASLNSITIRVQLLFWLSKNVTTNDTLLYRMSLFLTNIMMTFLILTVYYI